MSDQQTTDDIEVPFKPDNEQPPPSGGASGHVVEQPPQPSAQEVLDTIQPMRGARTQIIWTTMQNDKGEEVRVEYKYVQRELSMIAKAQWFSLVGDVMDRALGGENKLSLAALFEPPEGWSEEGISMQRMKEADTFMHALSKLIKFMPSFLEESFCIWLNVPDFEEPIVKPLMARSPEIGGISDDDGFAMVETFIDQNWDALEEWGRGKVAKLRKRIEEKQKDRKSLSASSTPSSSTQPITARQ